MKLIKITTRSEQDWSGKFVDDSFYDHLLNETATVLKPDGSLLLALFKRGHSPEALQSAWSVLKDYNPSTNNRGLASGSERRIRKRANGSHGNTNISDSVASGIVGFFERTPRFPYCRPCAWNFHNPQLFSKLIPICREASEFYKQIGGEKYLKQLEKSSQTHTDFMVSGTVFSTLTINKNFRTACHKDAGNLTDTLNVMSLFREGRFTGGNIVLPDFRIAAQLETGDCIVFDAHEFHGNTPIFQVSKEFTRCSIVFYYREGMDNCRSGTEEVERAKHRKPGEPLFDEDSP